MYTSASDNVHLCLRTINWVTFSVPTGRMPSSFCAPALQQQFYLNFLLACFCCCFSWPWPTMVTQPSFVTSCSTHLWLNYIIILFLISLSDLFKWCGSCGTPLSTPHNTVRENTTLSLELSFDWKCELCFQNTKIRNHKSSRLIS